MTSWIRQPMRKKPEPSIAPFYYQTDTSDFCTNFNSYFYAAAAAIKRGVPLYTEDRQGPLRTPTPMIRHIFADCSGVIYPEMMHPRLISLSWAHINRVIPLLAEMPQEELLARAKEILRFNATTVERNSKLRAAAGAGFPEQFDLGIHIRSGKTDRGRTKYLMDYVEAVRNFQKFHPELKTLSIFIVCDEIATYDLFKAEIRREGAGAWTAYSMEYQAPNFQSYLPDGLMIVPSRVRRAAYEQFVAELAVLQTVPNIICTMSSQVGRFIYLTHHGMKSFRSMDMQVFSIA